jgi:hypothetical protein
MAARGKAAQRSPLAEPQAQELLVNVLRLLARRVARIVGVCHPVAAAVRCVHLVDDVDLAIVALAELILGVHQQQATLGRLLLAKAEQGQGRRADLGGARGYRRGTGVGRQSDQHAPSSCVNPGTHAGLSAGVEGRAACIAQRNSLRRGRRGKGGVPPPTASQSAWLMWPCSTISFGEMGASWSSALVVGVMTLCAKRSFLRMPSGKELPQYSRAPFL